MERRTFMIGAIAGGIGLAEYLYTGQYMKSLGDPSRNLSVRQYAQYGPQAALKAITPNDQFYITSKGLTPGVRASSWRLKVDGLVARPFDLTYSQALALPRIEKDYTLECISNPIGGHDIGNARWTGTPLKPLIERAQPASRASHVILYAADGYSTGHRIERIWNESNFLAYRMNGDDLPPEHGYPVRIMIPGKFGMKQPKWVTRIEFVDHPYNGYWESRGWTNDAERWAQARMTDPTDGARLRGRSQELYGYAIGNLDGIKTVQLSFDNGHTWQNADIFSNPSPLVWSFWKFLWIVPKRGKYEILVRAIDGKGRIEGHNPRNIYPVGATGLQRIKVTAS
ncbi:MAG TPA: molybdopterin-dependent oxidoreductase [Terriglobia bacterium]|nr:molybdopterin-dependent oxidoreductase [Terriglobia bacterium]